MNRFGSALVAAAALGWLSATAPTACGVTTGYAPDAWVRGNTADASYFGWETLEFFGPPNAPFGSYRLDDATPELGVPTTALSPRLVQSPASAAIYGHRSSGGNYYSGFPDVDDGFPADAVADDTISAVAPASGAGGFTTVVLQLIATPPGAMGPNDINDLAFAMTTPGWTKQRTCMEFWPTTRGCIGRSGRRPATTWRFPST
jgi:hypothetical protein